MSIPNNLLSSNMNWSTMSASSPMSLPLPSVTPLHVDSSSFPPAITPPASSKKLFLGGAGIRWVDIEDKIVILTVIGVYLEAMAIPSLSLKWKDKNAKELNNSNSFFHELITGDFEKFVRVTMKVKLTGRQYSEVTAEYCEKILKSSGKYTKTLDKDIEKFLVVFRGKELLPGSSVFFTLDPKGSFTIALSKDEKIPRTSNAVVKNRLLGETILETMIGEKGISPATKKSLAERLSKLMNKHKEANKTPTKN